MNDIFSKKELDYLLDMCQEYANTASYKEKVLLNSIIDKINNINIICKMEGCSQFVYENGYCKTHYDSYVNVIKSLKKTSGGIEKKCMIKGCNNKHRSNGFCQKHFNYIYKMI